MTLEDAPSCQVIFDTAYRDLHRRHDLDVDDPLDESWLAPILHHFLTTDAAGSLMAKVDGVAVAFGCSIRRDNFWFLSFLFVLPEWQGRGLGRRMMKELLPRDSAVRATVVESFQPVSTGLYATAGMAPCSLKYWISGVSRLEDLSPLPNDIVAMDSAPGDLPDIDVLDSSLLGFARPADHLWWRAAGQRCYSFRRGGDLVAYAYVDRNFVGPVLAADQPLFCAVIGEVIRSGDEPRAMSVNISGHSDQLFRMLIGAGGRIDDHEPYRFVYCSSNGPLPASYVHHSDWLP